MSLHRCTDALCCYFEQPTGRFCGCHKTDEQVLREHRDELLAAGAAVLAEFDALVPLIVDRDARTEMAVKADDLRVAIAKATGGAS